MRIFFEHQRNHYHDQLAAEEIHEREAMLAEGAWANQEDIARLLAEGSRGATNASA